MPPLLRLESAPVFEPARLDAPPPLCAVSSGDPAVLLDIQRPGIGLAIWARDPRDGWEQDAASLTLLPADAGGEAVITASGPPASLARQLCQAMRSGCPAWFERDVSRLAALLSALAATAALSARFGPAPDREPPSGLRLCCRYGPGTLSWSYPAIDETSIQGGRTDPFAVLLLKGAASVAHRHRALRLHHDGPGTDLPGPTLCIDAALPP